MIRAEIQQLIQLGPFPVSSEVKQEVIAAQDKLLRSIKPPITDEEAKKLVTLFGSDDYFGIAWTILHLVESAPGWPIQECLAHNSNQWIVRLGERLH